MFRNKTVTLRSPTDERSPWDGVTASMKGIDLWPFFIQAVHNNEYLTAELVRAKETIAMLQRKNGELLAAAGAEPEPESDDRFAELELWVWKRAVDNLHDDLRDRKAEIEDLKVEVANLRAKIDYRPPTVFIGYDMPYPPADGQP